MRWRALQAGRIYIRQHPQDARLSVEELRDMVTMEVKLFQVEFFTLQPAYAVQGARPYWFKQRS